MTKEISISDEQARKMILQAAKLMERKIKEAPLWIVASDSYGEIKHRTWLFTLETDLVVGSIERYWEGLKMICSVLKGAPRTYFFTEDGERATSKDLKQKRIEE